ncbi:MAG: ribonuclease D [Alphaproteobacteria bacterium]|nr:ribonuclease D [Alphaproteobacteria bacterium]
MQVVYHEGDLPSDVTFTGSIAVDTETMGLDLRRDRLCVVQISGGDGVCHVIKMNKDYDAPNIKALMTDANITKIFHFARFDVAAVKQYLDMDCAPVYCTKIASKLARTNARGHGLKDLCKDLLGITLDKEEQTSDWGADNFSEEQLKYAATDVLYLHRLKEILDKLLVRESQGKKHDRKAMAKECFKFLPTRAALDLVGWEELDIFHH